MSQLYRGWFDGRPIPLTQKVQEALEYIQKKYGTPPNIVELPMLNEATIEIPNIEVKHFKNILPGHMLIGVQELGEKDECQRK